MTKFKPDGPPGNCVWCGKHTIEGYWDRTRWVKCCHTCGKSRIITVRARSLATPTATGDLQSSQSMG